MKLSEIDKLMEMKNAYLTVCTQLHHARTYQMNTVSFAGYGTINDMAILGELRKRAIELLEEKKKLYVAQLMMVGVTDFEEPQ